MRLPWLLWTSTSILGVLGLWAVPLSSSARDEAGFRPLFNGKDLGGWQRFGGEAANWTVADGMIVCHGKGGGWLGTESDHANFTLRLDFRLSADSNSGVYLRAPADTSHISRTGMEIQLLDEDAPKHKDIQPWQKTGAIYHVAAPKLGHLKPAGEWNHMEIEANGPRVIIRLNGAVIVDDRIDAHPDLEAEHTGLKRKTGRIGLQSHNGRVEFRNVMIRES